MCTVLYRFADEAGQLVSQIDTLTGNIETYGSVDTDQVDSVLATWKELITQLDEPAPAGLGAPDQYSRRRNTPVTSASLPLSPEHCCLWDKCARLVERIRDVDCSGSLSGEVTRLLGVVCSERTPSAKDPDVFQTAPGAESSCIMDVLETLHRRPNVQTCRKPIATDMTLDQVRL